MFDRKEYKHQWYLKNKEECLIKGKERYKNNIEQIKEYRKKHYQKYSKEIYQKTKEKRKIYRDTHKEERKLYFNKRYNTINGFTQKLWQAINSRTINGSCPQYNYKQTKESYLDIGVELRITKEQLKQFVKDNWILVQDMQNKKQFPSLDRIGPSIHYELGNIRFITRSENSNKNSILIRFIMKNYPDLYTKFYNECMNKKD